MIKKIFNPGNYPKNVDFVLLLLRAAIGGMMLTHGLGKLTMLFGNDPIVFPDPIGVGITTSLALAAFTQVICSIFLIFGVATRFSAIPLSITMVLAAFVVHANDDFAGKEMALLYLLIYVVLAIVGAGKYSIDNWLSKKIV
jgi:putative oxidoreductase